MKSFLKFDRVIVTVIALLLLIGLLTLYSISAVDAGGSFNNFYKQLVAGGFIIRSAVAG